MEKYLSLVSEEVRKIVLDLAASNGFTINDYNSTELIGFIQGAVSMYNLQQKRINELEIEIDLLEGEVK